MHHTIKKQLEKIEKQEKKYLQPKQEKGFLLLFEKGTTVIEKTYDKEKILWEHQFQEHRFIETGKRKQFKKLEKNAKHGNYINLATTATEGAVLGLLGIGLPDIPIFLGILLKGIYEKVWQFLMIFKRKQNKQHKLFLMLC